MTLSSTASFSLESASFCLGDIGANDLETPRVEARVNTEMGRLDPLIQQFFSEDLARWEAQAGDTEPGSGNQDVCKLFMEVVFTGEASKEKAETLYLRKKLTSVAQSEQLKSLEHLQMLMVRVNELSVSGEDNDTLDAAQEVLAPVFAYHEQRTETLETSDLIIQRIAPYLAQVPLDELPAIRDLRDLARFIGITQLENCSLEDLRVKAQSHEIPSFSEFCKTGAKEVKIKVTSTREAETTAIPETCDALGSGLIKVLTPVVESFIDDNIGRNEIRADNLAMMDYILYGPKTCPPQSPRSQMVQYLAKHHHRLIEEVEILVKDAGIKNLMSTEMLKRMYRNIQQVNNSPVKILRSARTRAKRTGEVLMAFAEAVGIEETVAGAVMTAEEMEFIYMMVKPGNLAIKIQDFCDS